MEKKRIVVPSPVIDEKIKEANRLAEERREKFEDRCAERYIRNVRKKYGRRKKISYNTAKG